MREIEIKVHVSDLRPILDAVQEQGMEVSDAVTQRDLVYGLPDVKGVSNDGEPWLRIRSETRGEATKHIFTLKKPVTGQLDSIEHETVIEDPAELAEIIRHIGFVPYSDLTKTRRKARKGNIEICLDHIDDLGDFVEAEILTDDVAEYQPIVDALWSLLESLGAKRTDEVTDGYDVLMNKKLGKE